MSYKNNTTDPSGNNGFLPTVIFAGTGTLTSAMRIAQLAAEGITGFYEAEFADGITSIDYKCFYKDTNVVVVSINKVSSIGTLAFNSCSNLRAITLDTATDPSTGVYLLTYIGQYAFEECSSLRNVYIPDSIKGTIGFGWFKGCTALEVCVIGNGFDEIILDYYMFQGCTSLKYIVIPENVTTIRDYAFWNCTSLATVVFNGIPSNGLSANAFTGAKNDSNATYIHDVAWSINSNLPSLATKVEYTTIDMPNVATLTNAGVNNVVSETTSWWKAKIHANTTTIDQSCFRALELNQNRYEKLVAVSIPEGVTTINYGAFENYISTYRAKCMIQGIYLPKSFNTTTLISGQSAIFRLDGNADSQIKQIVFRSGTTKTKINNFEIHYAPIYAVILPPTIDEITTNGVVHCTNVQLCNLFQKNAKSNLATLGGGACNSLGNAIPNKYIYLPKSLGLLGDTNTLYGLGSTTKIYVYSHVDGSINLGDKINSGNNLWAWLVQSNYFSGTLYVIASYHPNGVGLTGQPAYSGSHMLHVKEVNTISMNAFLNCGNYKTMAFDHYGGPNLIIGSNAFQGATNIEQVYLNDRLLDIVGEATFNGCTSLTSMILPDRLTSIPPHGFENCTDLSYVSIGPNSSIKKMDNHCFFSCLRLTNIHIPTATVSIGTNAFTANTLNSGLDTITFGGGSRLSSICARAFGVSVSGGLGPTKLTKLILPNNVSWMDMNVFRTSHSEFDVFIIPSKTDYIPHAMFYQEGYPYYALKKLYFPVSITADPGPRKRSNYADNGMDTYCFPAPQSACTAYMPSHMSSLFNTAENRFNSYSVQNNAGDAKSYTANYYKTQVVSSGGSITLSSSVANTTDPDSTTQRHIEFSGSPTTILGVSGDKTNLISVNIPRSVTTIGAEAFKGCSELVYVNFEEGSELTTINNNAFNGCSMLHEITLPSSLGMIHDHAFKDCSRMERIEIPYNVSYIGTGAFSSCDNLKHVTVYNSSFANTDYFNSDPTFLIASTLPLTNTLHPTKLTISQINNLYIYKRQTQLGIPTITFSADGILTQSVVSSQLADASVYTNSAFHVEFSEGVTSIGDNAFKDIPNVFSVAISKNITSIGSYAFTTDISANNVLHYLSFHPDSSCNNISANAFRYNKLFDLVLPDSLTTTGSAIFNGSYNLVSVCLPPNLLMSSNEGEFTDCPNLTNVRVPSQWSDATSGTFFSQTTDQTDLNPLPTTYTTPSVPHFKLSNYSMPIGIVQNLFDPSLNYIDHLAYAYYPEISVYAEPRNQMKFAGPFNYQINGIQMPCTPASFLQNKSGFYVSDFPIYRSIPDYVYLTADSTYGALDNVDDQYLIMPGYSVTVYNNLYEEGNILANEYNIAGDPKIDSHYKVADRADRFQHFDNEYGKKPAQIAMTNPKTGSSIVVMHSGKMVSKIYI